jgi:parallel beta-helix repeat protein
MFKRALPGILILAASLLPYSPTASAATYTVTNCSDSGAGSLRAVITAAGVNDRINFNLSTLEAFSAGNGFTTEAGYSFWRVSPASSLPNLAVSGLIINGSSQATGEGFTWPRGPRIELSGAGLVGDIKGLTIMSANNVTIEGLAVVLFPMDGIFVRGSSQSAHIRGCYLGFSPVNHGGHGNAGNGVYVWYGPDHCLIGGPTAAERNIISGNGGFGVCVDGYDESVYNETADNLIFGNYIGTDANAHDPFPNTSYGVNCEYALLTRIGGSNTGEGNVISGNGSGGIMVGGSSVEVKGNYIGTDRTGTLALGNTGVGIYLGGNGSTVGGTSALARNVISGNTTAGVYLSPANSNEVVGNYIGTDKNGTLDLGNGTDGIYFASHSFNNRIRSNVISGNAQSGIDMRGSGASLALLAAYNYITGNIIGSDPAGNLNLGNGTSGITLNQYCSYNVIGGGAFSADSNLISNNSGNGIRLKGANATYNEIVGNLIGTDATATRDCGNASLGIYLDPLAGNDYNIIGGSGKNNVISGNNLAGLAVGSSNNTISYNQFGTAGDALSPLPNANLNIYLSAGAQNNVIGPSNFIAFAPTVGGIFISGETSTGNRITQNIVFSNNPLGIDLFDGGNANLPYPVILHASPEIVDLGALRATYRAAVSGTAAAGALVEVFKCPASTETGVQGQGENYRGSATAAGDGSWNGPFNELRAGDLICATATDASGNTSEFSLLWVVGNTSTTTTTTTPTTTTTTGTSTTTTTGTTTTTSTLPIPEGKVFSAIRMSSSGALVNLSFTSRFSGPVKCFVEDIGVSPAGNLGTLDLQVSEGNNYLSLPAAKAWAGKLIRMTFVHGGVSYRVKGFVPATP